MEKQKAKELELSEKEERKELREKKKAEKAKNKNTAKKTSTATRSTSQANHQESEIPYADDSDSDIIFAESNECQACGGMKTKR